MSYITWCSFVPIRDCTARKAPAKVFLLAGDDNVEGYAHLEQLETMLQDPKIMGTTEAEHFAHLHDSSREDGGWATRDDVVVVYERTRHSVEHGPLTMYDWGTTSVPDDQPTFGPEVEVGHVMGNTFEEPVILVKAAWSG